MKIEFITRHKPGSFSHPAVVGTMETGPDGVVTGTGEGVHAINRRPRMPDFAHNPQDWVTPADGDAYIQAIQTEYRSLVAFTRVVDDTTQESEAVEQRPAAKPVNIDADVRNADWPKRTPDRMEDLMHGDTEPRNVRRKTRAQLRIWETARQEEPPTDGTGEV